MSKINISIDDISPHPKSSVGVLERCRELIEVFPDIKFTLFIPAAYWRTMGETSTAKALRLDHHPEFCDLLAALPASNFELAYHGLFHGIPGKSNNDEFKELDYSTADKTFKSMRKIVELSGLANKFKPYFRPPAWRMSPQSFSAARDNGIEVLALSPKQYALNTYQDSDREFGKVVYYNVNPPFDPLRDFDETEIVYHACEWDRNFLDVKLKNELQDFLANRQCEFVFLEGLL